jgi:hypothetical protein
MARKKVRYKQVHSRVIDSINLPRDTRVKAILAARPLLTKAVQMLTWYMHKHNVCSFSNITSHPNSSLLSLVKHLSMCMEARKFRIKQFTE